MLTVGIQVERKTSDMPARIWQALVDDPGLRIPALARNVGVSYSTIRWWLPRMCEHGFGVSTDDSGGLYPEIPNFVVDLDS
jgi:transposase